LPLGKLFLVATPIGNLSDITERALQTLRQVSFIACEDTRRSRILLQHYGISRELVSLPAFEESRRAQAIVGRIAGGEDCALITDAGSPGISDPGEKLVGEALARKIEVVPIPGPSALLAALSASGLPTSRFHFIGFLPRKSGERRAMLEEVAALGATLVFYESPRRVLETLNDCLEALGDRSACVARELTKVHEEFLRGRLSSLISQIGSREELKGEVVILIEGQIAVEAWGEEELRSALQARLASGEKLKELAKELSRDSGWSSQRIYRLGLSLKRD
jgi:16S rRNA (cytidine1402-2'-O)-methyltransferase